MLFVQVDQLVENICTLISAYDINALYELMEQLNRMIFAHLSQVSEIALLIDLKWKLSVFRSNQNTQIVWKTTFTNSTWLVVFSTTSKQRYLTFLLYLPLNSTTVMSGKNGLVNIFFCFVNSRSYREGAAAVVYVLNVISTVHHKSSFLVEFRFQNVRVSFSSVCIRGDGRRLLKRAVLNRVLGVGEALTPKSLSRGV